MNLELRRAFASTNIALLVFPSVLCLKKQIMDPMLIFESKAIAGNPSFCTLCKCHILYKF